MWGALPEDRMVLPFTIAAGPRQRSHSLVGVPLDSWPYFTFSDSRLPKYGGPRPRMCIYMPQEHGARLYPQALGSPKILNLSLSLNLTLRPTVSRPVCLGIKYPSGAYDQVFIPVSQLRVSWCRELSLPRGRVRHLQLLLALASAVILWSESRETRNHILLSQIWDFSFRRLLRLSGSPWRYSTPPPHECSRESESESELLYDWRFTANQSVLAPSPLSPTAKILLFFLFVQQMRS
jgi:hypothetical protein